MDEKIQLKIGTHIHLWNSYSLKFWLVFTISVMGLFLGNLGIFFSSYYGGIFKNLALLLTTVSFFFITLKLYSNMQAEKIKIVSLSKEMGDIYLPTLAERPIFKKIPTLIVIGTLYYLFCAVFLNLLIFRFFLVMWLRILLNILFWGAIIGLYIPFFIFLQNWNVNVSKEENIPQVEKKKSKRENMINNFLKKQPEKTYYKDI